MKHDFEEMAELLLEGNEFPPSDLNLDDQVTLVNEAVRQTKMLANDLDGINEAGNNLVTWLGGINKDVAVYGFQLMLRVKNVEFKFSDKSNERFKAIEEKYDFRDTGYEALNFNDLDHFAWPKVFSDDSTFEERLDALAEDYVPDDSPADMLLSGMKVPEGLDYNQRFQLAQDAVNDIAAMYAKYGKSNVLIEERFDRFLGWLLTIEDEILIFSIRNLMGNHRVVINPNNVKNWGELTNLKAVLFTD